MERLAQRGPAGAVLPRHRRMKSILVADDDPGYQRVCARILHESGYEVQTVGSGTEVLRTLSAARCDLLLIDIFMPEKDGLETIEVVHRQFPQVYVVGMSGGGDSGRAAEALAHARILGARAVLAKPFKAEELVTLVAAAIGPAA